MCSIDDSELFAIYESRERKARKPHTCAECRRDIAQGETYRLCKGMLPGFGWMQSKICAHCCVGADWLIQECRGFSLDMVREEIHEHAQEYQKTGLWRLVAGADRKWRRFDGSGLMAIPRLPPVTHMDARG